MHPTDQRIMKLHILGVWQHAHEIFLGNWLISWYWYCYLQD